MPGGVMLVSNSLKSLEKFRIRNDASSPAQIGVRLRSIRGETSAVLKTLIAFVAGLIAAPLLFVLAAYFGWLPSNATSNPPAWEEMLGMRAIDASLEDRSEDLKNPIAADDKAALAAGEKLFRDNCAGCHGDDKGPSEWGSRGFYPRAPQFYQEEGDVSPEEAYVAVRDGIRYSGMGAWRDLIKDDDIWKVANFVTQIEPKESVCCAKSAKHSH
jgi:mono/diheme cytochrome c family protein